MAIRLNYQSAALRVCVDKAEDGRFCGRIAGQRLSAPISFADINDFVVQVDAMLDAQRFPQAFQKIRTFTDKDVPIVPAAKTKEELSDFDVVNSVCGGIATFSFQVFSRKTSSTPFISASNVALSVSLLMSGWWTVWLPTIWPSSTIRRTKSAFFSM